MLPSSQKRLYLRICFNLQSSLDNDVPAIQTDRSCLFLYPFSLQMVAVGDTTIKRKERMVFLR